MTARVFLFFFFFFGGSGVDKEINVGFDNFLFFIFKLTSKRVGTDNLRGDL